MPQKFDFPAWLKGSPEEQAAEEQRQNLLRASFTRAHLTEAERLVGRGALLEATARENLAKARGRNKEARILAQNQLADALSMQGRHTEAAQLHTDKYRKKYFRDIVKAINTPDDEKCTCPDSHVKARDIELAITPRFERDRIFSSTHGELVSLVQCGKCKHKNARPLRSRLLRSNEARGVNEAIAASLAERKSFIPDVQVLNAQ